jgi:RimJ/RimL family protein N-acetyltransferase
VPKPSSSPLLWKPVPAPGPVILRGRHVTLEPLNAEGHASALWRAIRGHDELWTWLAEGPFATLADLRKAIEQKQAATSTVFLAIAPTEPRITEGAGAFMPLKEGENTRPSGPATPSAPKAAGWASYMRMEPAHGVVEVGNIMMSPSLQRTTAATEAMYLMARHIFDDLGYRRYEWKCNALNEPSRRAALRYGFTFEGIFRQHMVIKDLSRDTAWFSMLHSEWPARKRAFQAWLDPANFDNEGAQLRSLTEIASAKR